MAEIYIEKWPSHSYHHHHPSVIAELEILSQVVSHLFTESVARRG